jgi:hypothetical protein
VLAQILAANRLSRYSILGCLQLCTDFFQLVFKDRKVFLQVDSR